jgi:hypothetical protein
MSQYPTNPQDPNNPPPYDPYGTLDYQTVPTQPKPGSITFLAVLAIVFGGLGSLCTGFKTIAGLIQLAGVNLVSGPAGQMKLNPSLQAYGVFDAIIGLALWVTLLTIGIAALSLKPWARRAAVSWWSGVMILWAIVGVIVAIVWIGPATLELVKQMQQSTPGLSAPQMQSFMSASVVGGAVLNLLIQLLMPILFLALWRGPRVIGAFEGTVPAGAPGTGNPYAS